MAHIQRKQTELRFRPPGTQASSSAAVFNMQSLCEFSCNSFVCIFRPLPWSQCRPVCSRSLEHVPTVQDNVGQRRQAVDYVATALHRNI